MIVPVIKLTHTKSATLMVGSKDLAALLRAFALKACDMQDSAALEVTVEFLVETEGSPPYTTGTKARITVTEDQTKLPQVAT